MVTYTTNTTDISFIINEILAYANQTVVLSGCPSGPLTSINTSCLSTLGWSGSQGNTSTAGYYVNYDAQITNVYNALDIAIISLVQIGNSLGTDTITYTTNFTAEYLNNITVDIKASGSETVYIPQSQTCATACGCCTTCNKCSLSCACGLTTKSCNCTTTCTTWPSTYSASPHIGFNETGSGTLSGCEMKGEISLSVSINKPSSGTLQSPIYINNPDLPAEFYIYNSVLSNMTVTYSNITVKFSALGGLTTIPITISQSVAQSLVSVLFGDLQTDLNNLIKTNIFPVINTA